LNLCGAPRAVLTSTGGEAMSAAGPAAASATDLEGKLIALEKKRKQLESELELLRAAKGAAPEDEKKGYTELIHAKVEEVVAATKRITTTSAQLDVEAQRRAMGSDAQAQALTPFLPAQFVPGQPALATCAGGPSPRLMSLATATPSSSAVDASPTGAVIRDILHRLSDRFPRHVLVWPVLVQGEGAANQITAAIEGFQNIHEQGQPKPDLLIVARGGGSLEDLMAFNEENVVRAIAASTIPVISAVGHETDTTLADFAADLRAPTPTGAAEMAVPVRANLIAQILEDEQRLVSGMNRMLSENRHKLEAHSAKLGDPERLLEAHTQRLDHLGDKLSGVFARYLDTKQQRLIKAGAAIRHPQDRLSDAAKTLERWNEQLTALGPKLTKDLETKLKHAGKMLEAYSFENVLQRGFSVIRDMEGNLLTTAAQTADGQHIKIQFQGQEHVQATVGTSENTTPPRPTKRPKKTKKAASNTDDGQQTLF